MEEEGVVSIWAGVFETEEALMAYAAEEGYDCEGNEIISPFNRDFFGGEDLWPFDPDFWERALVAPTPDPEALVRPFSEGTAIGPALKKIFPQGLEKAYNAAILVYNYQYGSESACHPNAPVTFLGAVPCPL
ncbi:hypothetical protein D1159_14355 [Pseudoflavonifractor sp. 524-17]|uniref:immunity 22 family protein n=1 Tax=Pseudoflavonifractor sp. 524-17 TaxID=2304577 RepID=UPI001379E3BB|nr:immunity 22 family protein [Pseudoflavonifractor sp. 524-17]NCE65722.1 hypothetical protein [Pseudoflavonifractor sp. 524-17]